MLETPGRWQVAYRTSALPRERSNEKKGYDAAEQGEGIVKGWQLGVLGLFALALSAFAAPARADSHGTSGGMTAEESAAARQLTTLRVTFHNAFNALTNVREAEVSYSLARNNENTVAMRNAAALMLVSMAEARFWLALLDREVTATDFSEKIDKDVADLSALLVEAFDFVAEALYSNDLARINAALDEAAETFNRLFLRTNAVTNALWPRVNVSQ